MLITMASRTRAAREALMAASMGFTSLCLDDVGCVEGLSKVSEEVCFEFEIVLGDEGGFESVDLVTEVGWLEADWASEVEESNVKVVVKNVCVARKDDIAAGVLYVVLSSRKLLNSEH